MTTRFVGVIFGPPGAGKSTAAQLVDDVVVYDRDDHRWADVGEAGFTAALEALRHDRDARALVIRTGATAAARSRALQLTDASHAWMLTAPREVCHARVRDRGRDPAIEHPAVEQWFRNYEPDPTLAQWPVDGAALDLDVARVRAAQRGAELAPTCPKCKRRHLVTLPCWEGRYRTRLCEQVYRTKGRACWACRREGRSTRATTVDHVTPRSRCGTDALDNLEPACHPHNLSKGDRTTSPYGDAPAVAGNGRPVSSRFRT